VGCEREYVLDCLDSTWISSAGTYIERFETAFAETCGVRHAIACCNGTAAIHLALLALGLRPGDEVIVPTLTYVASVNPIVYCGARPILVDSEEESWNMDPEQVARRVTRRTRGIIAVHLYGHPVDMDPILSIARQHDLWVVEDAAEAHGARYGNRVVGSMAEVGTFSFYGNKIITCGEGGMVVTGNGELARTVRQLRGQGQDFERRYWFPLIGYNYRMTNISAAIGLGQLEQIDWHVARRRENAQWYRDRLGQHPALTLSPELPCARSAFWMNCAVLGEAARVERHEVMQRMAHAGIETRPFFYPVHWLPPYQSLGDSERFPIAERLSSQGMNLPSGATLTEDDVDYVCRTLVEIIS
jgi:perosamine synthetase